jgi:hypothetical protein
LGYNIDMEMSQGNSLCSYLKQAKMSSFFSLFYKIEGLVGRTGPAWGGLGEGGTSRKGEEVGKVCRSMNVVKILCRHVCTCM